ncbi:type VI secretion system tip protein TssI/VgrG [Pseudomonas sp. CCI1.2]|uniref:type VI secretion system Vgr family protein n=1 Tax=Pseudomonas sp. CCI1.2 TaxID=3048614 RepID=UPI002B236D3F|nr:type VI secretion system tip protein TssI/VgrG [Pseudomonas sp. CCI1.2]MEB0123219.1 type VI secretion system tip protein TssI/VgrG [Pseudomonas sp. CCI1.2]
MALNDHALCTFASLAPSLLLETLWVQHWQGEEKLSEPYRFEVRLATINPLFDDEALLGNRAVLTLSDALGQPHPYQGVVTEVDYLDADSLYYYYRVVLEPRFVQLRHFRFSEIWLDKSLPELIRDVLKLAYLNVEGPGMNGVPGSAYDFDIRLPLADEPLTQATFTCQFEETSFAFISRLLEYFGVYYFFEQGPDGEALVLCGDRLYQPQLPSLLTYRRQDSELEVGQALAVARTFERKLVRQVAGVTLQDFSASNAQLKLEVNASVANASLGADASTEQREAASSSPVFIGGQGLYGEHFGSLEQGQWLANRRAQAIGCRQREFHGSGRATGLRAGYPMLLVGHPRPLFNAGYQVIEVHHEGYQPLPSLGAEGDGPGQGINTRFIALPGEVQFRAPCVTPRPYVQGVLSAVVDGDEDTGRPLLNENGCYKVSFPFIRGEKNATRGSAWLRMATVSNGSSHGMAFPLLKGTEVLVSFLGGDPDRPVITSSVPNSENPARVAMDNATQSGINTPGGHYLAMEDSASGPMMRMGAPVGNTKLTLGEGNVSGAHLQTDNHMQLASNSYKHEVSDMYSHSMGGGFGGSSNGLQSADSQDPPATDSPPASTPASTKPAAAAKKSHDFFPAFSHTGRFQGYQIAPTATFTPSWSIKMEATLEQTSASIGLLKQSLSVMGWEVAVSIAGPKTTYTLHPGVNVFKTGFEELNAVRKQNALNSKKSNVNELKAAVNSTVTTGTHVHKTAALVTFSCGPHSISLTPSGISIDSAIPVSINADVNINGSLVVSQTGIFKTCTTNFLKVGQSINALKIACLSFNSLTSKQGFPFVPSVVVEEMEMIAVVNTAGLAQKAAEAAGKTINAAAVAENDAAQIVRALAAITDAP